MTISKPRFTGVLSYLGIALPVPFWYTDRMKPRLKIFAFSVLAFLIVVPQVARAYQNSLFNADSSDTSSFTARCENDPTIDAYARQRVNNAATAIQTTERMPDFAASADYVKKTIDSTSLRTGGKLRDIYVGGASFYDKEGMVEEFLRDKFGPLDEQLRGQAEAKADEILHLAEDNLNQPVQPSANSEGDGSYSTSLDQVETERARHGSFKLQQRNSIGLFEDVGRFSYTVTARTEVSVDSISFDEQYSTCADSRPYTEFNYGTRVTVTPYLEVEYYFDHLGGDRTWRYDAFSGSFTIIDSQDEIERELAVDNPSI